jgi:hypothetical protein
MKQNLRYEASVPVILDKSLANGQREERCQKDSYARHAPFVDLESHCFDSASVVARRKSITPTSNYKRCVFNDRLSFAWHAKPDMCHGQVFEVDSTSTSTLLIIQVPIRSGHRLPELNVNLVFLTVFGVQERFSDFQQGQNPLVRSKAICEF